MSHEQELVVAALPMYDVDGELGRGAWGVVIAGRHRQLGRDVAIKQLPRAFGADAAVRSRFVAEGRLLASLNHTHIVPIYDFVEHEGLCLLVMERLTGGTVWSRFRAGALTPERSVAVALAASSALQYAHKHGVLHRDVKPDNLLFSEEGVLKVTDFGIAKVVGGSATVATRAGDVLGTPAYMAPEQAQGGTLGPATDVYSLGMVLYELLAGRLPFPEDSDPLTTLYRHVHERPRPLSETASHIPSALAQVVARALEADPAERYPDAEAFGIAVASAAAEVWGGGWLSETGIIVAASGPVLGAALGGPTGPSFVKRAETLVGQPVAAAAIVDPVPHEVTPAELVPVNLLRPEGSAPPPLVESPAPPPPDVPPPAPAAPPPAPPAAPRAPGGRAPRWLIPAGAVVLVVALLAAYLATRGGSPTAKPARRAPSSTAPATTVVPLQPVAAWRALHDAPTARQQMAATASGGTVWVLGGLTGDSSTAKVEGYDPAIDTWKSGPDLPLPLHHEAAVTYHDELVALGGWVPDGRALTATVSDKVFALRSGRWVELPHLLHPRAAAAAAAVGDKIVVFGGQAGGKLVENVEVFDGQRWSEGAPLPTAREHLAGASDGRFAYAVGGRLLSSDKNVGAVERYDPSTGRWEKLPDLPTARGGLAAAAVGGRLVALGGESPTGVFNTVELLDLSTNTWSAGPAMSPRHGLAVAAMGSSLYAFGGARQPSHTDSTAAAEALDFTSTPRPAPTPSAGAPAWRSLHDAPTARQQMAATAFGGTVWVLGGLTGDGSTAKVEGYDPAIDTWKSGPDLPLPLHHEAAVTYHDELVVLGGWVPDGHALTATVSDKVFALRNGQWLELPHLIRPRAAAAAAVVGDQIIVFGGQAGGKLVETVEVFDGRRWFETAGLPTPREHLAGASDGHFAYAVGGRLLSSDKNVAAVERYDPVAGRWEKLPDLPTARGGLAAAVVGGRLVALGGESPTGVFDTVELFDLSANSWSAGPAMGSPRHGLAVAAMGSSLYAFGGARQPSHTDSTAAAEVLDF